MLVSLLLRLAGTAARDAARQAVQTHVDHLLAQADAYAAKHYARSDALYRESYAHTFDVGHTLAATLLPPDQAAGLDQPSWRLRSALDRLLGEHVALAVAVLRAGGTNRRLVQLKQGAEVVVDRADGSTAAFRVSGTLHVPKVQFPQPRYTDRRSSRHCAW